LALSLQKGKKELEETLDVLRAQIQDKEKEIKQLKVSLLPQKAASCDFP